MPDIDEESAPRALRQHPAWLPWVVAGIVSALGGGAWAGADAVDQRFKGIEARVAIAEGRLDGVESLRRDVARLEATVTAQTEALRRDVARVEAVLERRQDR